MSIVGRRQHNAIQGGKLSSIRDSCLCYVERLLVQVRTSPMFASPLQMPGRLLWCAGWLLKHHKDCRERVRGQTNTHTVQGGCLSQQKVSMGMYFREPLVLTEVQAHSRCCCSYAGGGLRLRGLALHAAGVKGQGCSSTVGCAVSCQMEGRRPAEEGNRVSREERCSCINRPSSAG